MFDWNEHLRDVAQHLLRLAAEPGWTEYARARRDQLIANPIYGQALRDELQRQRKLKDSSAHSSAD